LRIGHIIDGKIIIRNGQRKKGEGNMKVWIIEAQSSDGRWFPMFEYLYTTREKARRALRGLHKQSFYNDSRIAQYIRTDARA